MKARVKPVYIGVFPLLLVGVSGIFDVQGQAAYGAAVHRRPVIVAQEEQRRTNADAAAATVRRATGGRVLGVRYGKWHGRSVYQVKVLLSGGRVQMRHVDAGTGVLLD